MTAPVRIQLSRAKGFNLQEHSRSINGLPAAKVDRTTKCGNPYRVGDRDHNNDLIEDTKDAVDAFRALVDDSLDAEAMTGTKMPILEDIRALRGKNIACWCGLEDPCHGDIVLKVANR